MIQRFIVFQIHTTDPVDGVFKLFQEAVESIFGLVMDTTGRIFEIYDIDVPPV